MQSQFIRIFHNSPSSQLRSCRLQDHNFNRQTVTFHLIILLQIVNLIESHNDSRPRTIYHVNDTDIDLDSRRLVDENDRVLTNEHSR